MTFTTATHAKYILSGEHYVLREGSAIVFPVPSMELRLLYEAGENSLDFDIKGNYKDSLVLIFWGVIEQSLRSLGREKHILKGKITIENNIPLGMGLGFSAAFCVAITRWFVFLGLVPDAELISFSTRLEDYFHGLSSGVDVLGVMSSKGVYVLSGNNHSFIEKVWSPRLYLMCSDRLSITSECVTKVDSMHASQPTVAKEIDENMHRAVGLAMEGLRRPGDVGFKNLSEAICLAQTCFERWGLVPGDVREKINFMYKSGAEAVKITGAGDGGFLLGLWREKPGESILRNLVAL